MSISFPGPRRPVGAGPNWMSSAGVVLLRGAHEPGIDGLDSRAGERLLDGRAPFGAGHDALVSLLADACAPPSALELRGEGAAVEAYQAARRRRVVTAAVATGRRADGRRALQNGAGRGREARRVVGPARWPRPLIGRPRSASVPARRVAPEVSAHPVIGSVLVTAACAAMAVFALNLTQATELPGTPGWTTRPAVVTVRQPGQADPGGAVPAPGETAGREPAARGGGGQRPVGTVPSPSLTATSSSGETAAPAGQPAEPDTRTAAEATRELLTGDPTATAGSSAEPDPPKPGTSVTSAPSSHRAAPTRRPKRTPGGPGTTGAGAGAHEPQGPGPGAVGAGAPGTSGAGDGSSETGGSAPAPAPVELGSGPASLDPQDADHLAPTPGGSGSSGSTGGTASGDRAGVAGPWPVGAQSAQGSLPESLRGVCVDWELAAQHSSARATGAASGGTFAVLLTGRSVDLVDLLCGDLLAHTR
ncbi:MAG: hypothetical protein JNL54_15690 [Kineosporiaceae bacterium]|nr:hypothetical protein [Kineosporiaceae bacterium]